MKKLGTIIICLTFLFAAHGQEAGKVRGGFDLGYARPLTPSGGGFLLGFDVNYNIQNNLSVGIRSEVSVMAKIFDYGDNSTSEEILEGALNTSLSANSSYLLTCDYYFLSGKSKVSPFIGGGLGYYGVGNVSVLGDSDLTVDGDGEYRLSGKPGLMLRTGIEFAHLRLTAEGNFLPRSKFTMNFLELPEPIAVQITNMYVGVSLGVYFGGGKWKKSNKLNLTNNNN